MAHNSGRDPTSRHPANCFRQGTLCPWASDWWLWPVALSPAPRGHWWVRSPVRLGAAVPGHRVRVCSVVAQALIADPTRGTSAPILLTRDMHTCGNCHGKAGQQHMTLDWADSNPQREQLQASTWHRSKRTLSRCMKGHVRTSLWFPAHFDCPFLLQAL